MGMGLRESNNKWDK